MKKYSGLLLLVSMASSLLAEELVSTHYYLSNKKSPEAGMVMIKRVNTYRHKDTSINLLKIGATSAISQLLGDRVPLSFQVSDGIQTHVTYRTEIEHYPEIPDEALNIAARYNKVTIAKEAVRQGGTVTEDHILTSMRILQGWLTDHSRNQVGLKVLGSYVSLVLWGLCVAIVADAYKYSDKDKVVTLGACAAPGVIIGSWVGIRYRHNEYSKVAIPETFDYLIKHIRLNADAKKNILNQVNHFIVHNRAKSGTQPTLANMKEYVSGLAVTA